MNIDATVALPSWDSKNILWLQLESLCRQNTQYSWELIICEEQLKNFAGEDYIKKYINRLSKAGCVQVLYIPLTEHVPLSKKWSLIADRASGVSYLLASADDYSFSNRIELTHSKILEGYDWFDISETLFLNLHTFKTGTYDHNLKSNNQDRSSVFMGTRTNIMQQLKGPPWPSAGIDSWVKSQADKTSTKQYRHQEALDGLCTDGANKISGVINVAGDRRKMYCNGYTSPFRESTQTVEDILPADIILKLKNNFLSNHV